MADSKSKIKNKVRTHRRNNKRKEREEEKKRRAKLTESFQLLAIKSGVLEDERIDHVRSRFFHPPPLEIGIKIGRLQKDFADNFDRVEQIDLQRKHF
jgi:hypothetical protein